VTFTSVGQLACTDLKFIIRISQHATVEVLRRQAGRFPTTETSPTSIKTTNPSVGESILLKRCVLVKCRRILTSPRQLRMTFRRSRLYQQVLLVPSIHDQSSTTLNSVSVKDIYLPWSKSSHTRTLNTFAIVSQRSQTRKPNQPLPHHQDPAPTAMRKPHIATKRSGTTSQSKILPKMHSDLSLCK